MTRDNSETAQPGRGLPLIKPPDLTEVASELQEAYETAKSRHAHFDSLRRILLRFPPAFRAVDGMYDLIMRPGLLGRIIKEQIFLTCSAVRGCDYATEGHGGWLIENGDLTREEIAALVRGEDLPRHNQVETAVLSFARRVAAAPYKTIPADMQRLRLVGLEERGMVEVLAVVSLSGWMNGYAKSLGLSSMIG